MGPLIWGLTEVIENKKMPNIILYLVSSPKLIVESGDGHFFADVSMPEILVQF